MKKFPLYLMMMVLSLSIFPSTVMAAEPTTAAVTANTKEMPAEVKVMFNRLEEIKAMDKSSLSRSEKKELRKEVRAIKSELKATGNGVYISVGAIIIIILLLILIF
ncbi:MAG: hypothetical protein V4572_12940 [Bacteroidota bacterium]